MNLKTYYDMLSFMRPKGSVSEQYFRERYLLNLPHAWADVHGNIHVETDRTSRILFSAHTDTVHRVSGRQTLHIDGKERIVELSKRSRNGASNCLGADDTTGCFIMREMILADVPGYYVFHYGEESGGLGSSALAWDSVDWLRERFSFALAFDRRGYKDVITHQFGDRTASNQFAKSLANTLRLPVGPAHGIYTDTAEYARIIPECSNLSVGYHNEHSTNEWQDTEYLDILLTQLLQFDESLLVVKRDPSECERERKSRWSYTNVVSIDRDTSMADIYLDETYAQVQAALRTTRLCPHCGELLSDIEHANDMCFYCNRSFD